MNECSLGDHTSFKPLKNLVLYGSCSVNQRTNVISCVTVHDSQDSDSSTSTPLSPKHRPKFVESNTHSKSLAVVTPSVKTQLWEGASGGS